MGVGDWIGWASQLLSLVGVVVSLAVGILILRLKSEFATIAALATQGETIDEHHTRLTKLEARMESVPTKDDFHELAVSLERIAANVGQAVERMNGIEGGTRRLELTVDRIHTHLMNERA